MYRAGIEVFLDNSSSKLLKNFDSSCQSVLVHHIDRMLENVKKILSEAMILCKMDSVNLTESCMCVSMHLYSKQSYVGNSFVLFDHFL